MANFNKTTGQILVLSGTVLSILIIGGILGCSPTSSGKSNGIISCIPTGSRPEFVVATFNIHAGVGIDGQRELDRIADTLKGVDFAGMQEVDHGRIRSGISNQARVIAERLGHSYWEHFPAEEYWPIGAYGNAASASLPVIDSGMFDLPVIEGEALRTLVWVKFLIDCRPVNAFVIHITNADYEKSREIQIEAAINLMNQTIGMTGEPVIFMGDFNSPPTDAAIQELRKHFTDSVLKKSLPMSVKPGVDYIFIKGELEIVNVLSKDIGASDHPAILVTLR